MCGYVQSFHNSLIQHRPLLGFTVNRDKNGASPSSNRWRTMGSAAFLTACMPVLSHQTSKRRHNQGCQSQGSRAEVKAAAQRAPPEVLLLVNRPQRRPVARGKIRKYHFSTDYCITGTSLYIAHSPLMQSCSHERPFPCRGA